MYSCKARVSTGDPANLRCGPDPVSSIIKTVPNGMRLRFGSVCRP